MIIVKIFLPFPRPQLMIVHLCVGPVQSIDVPASKSAENAALRASRHDFVTLNRCSKKTSDIGPNRERLHGREVDCRGWGKRISLI